MDTYFFGIFVNNLCTTLINNKNKGCTLLLKSERKLFLVSVESQGSKTSVIMKDLFQAYVIVDGTYFFFVKAVTETTKNFDFNSVNVYLHESVTDLFVNAQDQPNCANFARRIFEQVCYYALLR